MSCARISAALKTPGLTTFQQMVYVALIVMADGNQCRASIQAIADQLARSAQRATVYRAIEGLVEKDLVRIEKVAHGVSRYHLLAKEVLSDKQHLPKKVLSERQQQGVVQETTLLSAKQQDSAQVLSVAQHPTVVCETTPPPLSVVSETTPNGGNPPKINHDAEPSPRARGDSLYLVKKEEEETLFLGTGEGGKGKGGMGGKENPNPEILPPSQCQLVVDAWNEMAKRSDLPCAKTITPQRRQRIRDRLREHGMDGIREAIERIDQSDFCHGANDRAWKADFDFLLQTGSMTGAREGRYDNRTPKLSMSQATGAVQILNQLRQKREVREYEQNNLLGAEPVA